MYIHSSTLDCITHTDKAKDLNNRADTVIEYCSDAQEKAVTKYGGVWQYLAGAL